MRLSQGQLTLLETCPRKFQHTYIEQMGAPLDPEQQLRLSWGNRFHLVMQQAELGLPVAALVQEDAQLKRWFAAFSAAAAQIGGDAPPIVRQSEQVRTLEWAGHLLTVVYDLVICTADHAEILDWKTYPKPQQPQALQRSWQTRLYPFVLAETSDYAPQDIAMRYWFFQVAADRPSGSAFPSLEQAQSPEPQSLKFSYDRTQHQKTQRDLTQLLTQLTDWLAAYEKGTDFPQVPEAAGHCATCSFAVRCQRGRGEDRAIGPVPLPALADIPEIPL
jgi:PD-(D/E)XK nuclease superfamily